MSRLRTPFPASLDGARSALRQVWGYDAFRPAQEEVLAAVLTGRDVLAVLPTGGGKSLLYQIPALLGDGLVVVVSPLIALMQDQVAALQRVGVTAIALNSTLGVRKVEQALIDARYGKYDILYVTPERLATELFQASAPHLNVKLLAVDEAHCVSEWAPSFRPSYRLIPEARALLGDPPVLAVTATATPEVCADVEKLLGLRDPRSIIQGFDRPNLTLTVLREDNKRARVLDVLRRIEGTGILYASTRRSTEEWGDWLRGEGVSAAIYHGGMDAADRSESAAAWMRGAARVMVATNAFGMGIDRPDVRFVVHVDVPGSLEAYYQEAGRGGRDGQTAHAVLLWQPRDLDTQRTLIDHAHPTSQQLAAIFDAVGNLAQVPVGTLPAGPIPVRVETVAEVVGVAPALVRNALDVLERAEVLRVEARYGDGAFRWNASRDALLAATRADRAVNRFIERLLRCLPREAFDLPVDVSLADVARAIRLPPERAERGLVFLTSRGLAVWEPHGDALRVTLCVPRSRKLSVQDRWLEGARKASVRRFEYMTRYLSSAVCRRRYLLGYFGERAPDVCGRCDVCLRRRHAGGPRPADEPLLRHLLDAIHQSGVADRPETDADGRAPALLTWLVQEGYVRATDVLAQQYVLTPDGERYRSRLSRS